MKLLEASSVSNMFPIKQRLFTTSSGQITRQPVLVSQVLDS